MSNHEINKIDLDTAIKSPYDGGEVLDTAVKPMAIAGAVLNTESSLGQVPMCWIPAFAEPVLNSIQE